MRLIDKIYIMLKEGTCCIYIFLRTCIDPTQLSRSYPNEEANAADITRSLKKLYIEVYTQVSRRDYFTSQFILKSGESGVREEIRDSRDLKRSRRNEMRMERHGGRFREVEQEVT